MAAYRRVYDSHHLQADLPRTGISSGTLRSVIEYGLPLPFYCYTVPVFTHYGPLTVYFRCGVVYLRPSGNIFATFFITVSVSM